MATRFVDRIAYEISPPQGGSGDAVLMIHGLGGSSNTWVPLLPALSAFGLIRMDLPGSGRSHRTEGALSMERFVQAAQRVLADAGLQRAHVVAHSMGAIVALHLAALVPSSVRSLALFGPLLALHDSARNNVRARAQKARNEREDGMQNIADALVQASTSAQSRRQNPLVAAFVRESLMRQCPDGYARCCEALADAQPADVSRINCAALLVTGDEDIIAPPQAVRGLAERLGQTGNSVQFDVLRGCGHWTPIEQPDSCIALLRRFYSRSFGK